MLGSTLFGDGRNVIPQLRLGLLLAATAALALAGCDRGGDAADANASAEAVDVNAGADAGGNAGAAADPIESAMAAAPAPVSGNATIVQARPDGSMTTLREGNNGWTCMPDNPVSPGPDPMCMDRNALAWARAWMEHREPPMDRPGFMYMLAGGSDASNTDPYAEAPAVGNDWIETGPHVMIVGSTAILNGYPTGPSPDTSLPYVMWAGTPYAHLMIPIR